MPAYPLKQVDAFSNEHFRGNPVAVVLDAQGIADVEMQAAASWTNLSETTFFLPPTTDEADYHLRIYTPAAEIPFAGHPTVGSAHAALEAGAVTANGGKLRQQCGIGVIELTIEGDGPDRIIFFEAQPKIVKSYETSVGAISAALGAEIADDPAPTTVDVGAVWTICRFEDPNDVKNLRPDMTAVSRLADDFGITGICAFAFGGEDGADLRLRCFAPKFGVPEDPVTGSANACLGRFLAHSGFIEQVGREYVASQGTALGREGRVYVRVSADGESVMVGGQAVTTIDGTITVP